MAGGYFNSVLAYCSQNDVTVPKSFQDEDPSKFVLIDISVPQNPRLVIESFDYEKQIYDYLKQENVHPWNYRVLNFKTGREYTWTGAVTLTKSETDF